MQKLVIFDLDGTLIDTVVLVVEAFSNAFVSAGVVVPDEKTIRSISGLRLDIAVQRLAPNANETELNHIHGAYREAYLTSAKSSNREELFAGAKAVLQALGQRQDIELAVATGKPLAGVNRVVQAHDLHGVFTSLQTPDTCVSKPDPDMIDQAMGIVSASASTTVMIGDTTHDMEMARNAGVHALGVSWGYHEPEELKEAGAHMIIDDVAQMLGAIDHLIGKNDA